VFTIFFAYLKDVSLLGCSPGGRPVVTILVCFCHTNCIHRKQAA